MCGSDCSIEKVFEAHRISHHPTRYTITPYNSSDDGLTATMLLLLNDSPWRILFARQQLVPSSDGSSACYRWHFFCNTAAAAAAAAAVLSFATLDEVQRQTATMKRMRAPRAPNECSRKRRDEDVCLNTAGSSTQTPYNPRAGHEAVFNFRLPHSRVSNTPRKSTKTKLKLQSRSD